MQSWFGTELIPALKGCDMNCNSTRYRSRLEITANKLAIVVVDGYHHISHLQGFNTNAI